MRALPRPVTVYLFPKTIRNLDTVEDILDFLDE